VANLTVRDVDEDVARALRVRAAAHGRSAEAEHRQILREVLAASEEEVEAYAAAAARLRARLRHEGEASDIIREARDTRQR
jgi:plasmid stability protein